MSRGQVSQECEVNQIGKAEEGEDYKKKPPLNAAHILRQAMNHHFQAYCLNVLKSSLLMY
jgi:hypothetical protein